MTAALDLVDDEGVDQLTMRRLGSRLGVDPMAVYYHVANKAALCDGIVELLWSGVRLPAPVPGETWQQIVSELFIGFRQRLLAHPRAVVLVGTRPGITSTLLRLIDETLGRLSDAGLGAADAMQLIDCLSGYTVGKVLAEIGVPDAGASDAVGGALAAVDPSTHPHLVRALVEGYVAAPDAEFRRGLDALVSGWSAAG